MPIFTWALKDNVEVQTEDTDGGIILDTQINVFLDTEAKVAKAREVITTKLVFTNLGAKEINCNLDVRSFT